MKPAVVVPCGCCKALLEPEAAFFDPELEAHVCDDCRGHLAVAKAELLLVGVGDVYHGADAPDNTKPQPPAQPETL